MSLTAYRTPEPAARLLLNRFGGPLGRHASTVGSVVRGPGALMLIGTLSWLVLMLRQVPCRQSVAGQPVNTFYRLCYTDIPVLYQVRGLAEGQAVYTEVAWEYPVLTGWLVQLAAWLTNLLGVTAAPGLSAQQVLDNANIFFAVCSVLLFVCFLGTIELTRRMLPDHGWTAGLMLAASPVVMANGLINWDFLAVVLTAAAMFVWARGKPFWAGLLYGLAVAAKLYPLFILGPLVLLLVRARQLDALSRLLAGATAAWLAVNLPVWLVTPNGWLYFWSFNQQRGADLGSIWYVMSLGQIPVSNVNLWSMVFLVAACFGVAVLVFVAPRPPRVGQVAFIVVTLFLVLNKVYSPQYALWLLPLLVLARPQWRAWAVWTVGELVYFAAIWGHLAGTLRPGSGGADRVYWLAVFIRVVVQLWLVLGTIGDILRPHEDPVRAGGVGDPIGGVLDDRWLERVPQGGKAARHLPTPEPEPDEAVRARHSSSPAPEPEPGATPTRACRSLPLDDPDDPAEPDE